MIDNIAGALGGPVAAGVGPLAQAAGNIQKSDTTSMVPAPTKMSAVPAWGIAMSLGKQLAKSFIDQNPEWADAMKEEDLAAVMQSLMNEVTKSLGESLDYLKELDDEEDACAATAIYKQ